MLTTLLLLLALLFALPAMADDNINFTLSVEPSSLTAPGPVTVSVRVVNAGETDMTEPVMLYDPSGALVPTFGDGGQALIKKGDYVTAQHTYNVTQQQLDEGKLTYMLSYNDVDASGNVVVKSLSASAALTFTGTAPRLTVNRTIDPEVVRNGKTATVQYELYNSGNVEIKNIRVEENTSISANAQTVTSLAPGERKTIKFTATMRQKDLTSRGKVTYKAGDESLSQELPAVTIPKANPGLVLDEILTADKTSIENGDTVTLTLTIKNNGNITYSNISVTDAKYGEIFTNLTLGPGETLVREKQFTLSESTSFKYSVTLPDNTGATNVISSNEVKISVYNPGPDDAPDPGRHRQHRHRGAGACRCALHPEADQQFLPDGQERDPVSWRYPHHHCERAGPFADRHHRARLHHLPGGQVPLYRQHQGRAG